MRLFSCSSCSSVVYFENHACETCGHRLGYHPPDNRLYALKPERDIWRPIGARRRNFRFCANAEHGACNWLIRTDQPETFCTACRHNRVIPDLSIEENVSRWRKMELAKHHMFYGLLRLGLPLDDPRDPGPSRLWFEFLSDEGDGTPEKVLTGHNDGTITLNLAEADDAERERRRTEMREPYRTLLGHFRHEIGHYYWDRLVRDGGRVDDFRQYFGDESQDYAQSLKTYYAEGPPARWSDNFISAYATSHPWEDFAETWAHYLHIADTLEMAGSCGIQLNSKELRAKIDLDPYFAPGIDQLVNRWRPVAIAVNSINRCMGQPDLYPFVLTQAVVAKLGFVHELVHQKVSENKPEIPTETPSDPPTEPADAQPEMATPEL